MASSTPVATPGGNVDFNDNTVSGAKLTGGYTAFQLWPNGKKISPVTASFTKVTLANVTSLFCYKQDDSFDLFLPRATADYKAGETVVLQGPLRDPLNSTLEFIQMTGEASTESVNFYLTTSTTPGDKFRIVDPLPGTQSYKITITVEFDGKAVLSTTANI